VERLLCSAKTHTHKRAHKPSVMTVLPTSTTFVHTLLNLLYSQQQVKRRKL